MFHDGWLLVKGPGCVTSGNPNGGSALQPRVVASTTLGRRLITNFNPNGVVSISKGHSIGLNADTTPLGLETVAFVVSQGSRGGNPGLEGTTPLGLDTFGLRETPTLKPEQIPAQQAASSEQQLHSELNVPRVARRRDAAKGGRPEKIVRQIEVRMIEEIKHLSPELQIN